jgi:hypothetical protein
VIQPKILIACGAPEGKNGTTNRKGVVGSPLPKRKRGLCFFQGETFT